jgi:shikimate kinase
VDEEHAEPTTALAVPRCLRSIVLVGLMGAGKTAVGKRLAARLAVPFTDSDHAIEDAAGMTVADIFETYGEPEFRALERRVIQRLLAGDECGVVALGGGAFVDGATRELVLRRGHVVWLQADIDVLVERTARKPGKRPLLAKGDPKQVLSELHERRAPFYRQAHDVVRSGTTPLADVVDAVLASARAAGAVR